MIVGDGIYPASHAFAWIKTSSSLQHNASLLAITMSPARPAREAIRSAARSRARAAPRAARFPDRSIRPTAPASPAPRPPQRVDHATRLPLGRRRALAVKSLGHIEQCVRVTPRDANNVFIERQRPHRPHQQLSCGAPHFAMTAPVSHVADSPTRPGRARNARHDRARRSRCAVRHADRAIREVVATCREETPKPLHPTQAMRPAHEPGRASCPQGAHLLRLATAWGRGYVRRIPSRGVALVLPGRERGQTPNPDRDSSRPAVVPLSSFAAHNAPLCTPILLLTSPSVRATRGARAAPTTHRPQETRVHVTATVRQLRAHGALRVGDWMAGRRA
jgi:hypothetical protein